MLFTLFLALILLIVVFSRSAQRKKNLSVWKQYRTMIFVVSTVLLTILVMNIYRPNVIVSDLDKIIELSDEDDDEYHAFHARKSKSEQDPHNVRKLFDYVAYSEFFETYDKPSLQNEIYSKVPKMQRLALAYLDALVTETKFDSLYKIDPDGIYNANYPDKSLPFHNYVIGVQQRNDGYVKKAINSFLREKKLNPDYGESYLELYSIYRSHDRDAFHRFIVDPKNTEHIWSKDLASEYFLSGEYRLYFKTIYARRFLEMNFFAFLAGLVISIVWMIFLRKMDFFNKERWLDMILVFVGGALFTILCHFFYHTAHYDLGIILNGDFWNDLFYCVAVIGFSEELVKLAPWILFAVLSKRMKEPYDYLLYASVAALGFAFTENLRYLEDPINIVIRSLTSTTMHMFAASLVAYCIVLAKFKYKTKRAKILAPIIGFLLACFAHGFYDFWLISKSIAGLEIVTTIFFLLTIHIWFHMINNSTNHSSFFNKRLFRINENIEFLSIAIIGFILLQYVILSIEYGALSANSMLKHGTTFTIGFLLYVTFILANFKPVRGKWKKYSFPMVGLIKEYITLPFLSGSTSVSQIGLHLRIFCPKSNRYIGDQLPISGHCERKITVNGKDDWYLFRLNTELKVQGMNSTVVILKPKSAKDELSEDKIELYLMLIPMDIDFNDSDLPIKFLRYTGKTYSMPV